jgi:hypothetical protein
LNDLRITYIHLGVVPGVKKEESKLSHGNAMGTGLSQL